MEEKVWFVNLTLNKTFVVCASSKEEAKELAIKDARKQIRYDSLCINEVEEG